MQRSKLKSHELGSIKKLTSRQTRLDGLTWVGGITCHPILCPMGKDPLPTPHLPFRKCLTRGKRLPSFWCLPMGCPQHTLRRPQPVVLSLCLQSCFSSASPIGRTPASSPQAGGWDFGWEGSRSSWIQQLLFLHHPHPAGAALHGAQLCSFHDSRWFKHYLKKKK